MARANFTTVTLGFSTVICFKLALVLAGVALIVSQTHKSPLSTQY